MWLLQNLTTLFLSIPMLDAVPLKTHTPWLDIRVYRTWVGSMIGGGGLGASSKAATFVTHV